MRTLTDREKRTIRFGAIGLAVYLSVFIPFRVWKALEAERAEYRKLVTSAQMLKVDLQRYETKSMRLEKLKERFKLDLSKLSKGTVASETSVAIQKLAQSGGVQLGPIRESPGSRAGRELSAVRLEATGQIPAITLFLHRLENLGYPVLVDSVQLNAETKKPGMVKLMLNLVILDFEPWQTNRVGRPNA